MYLSNNAVISDAFSGWPHLLAAAEVCFFRLPLLITAVTGRILFCHRKKKKKENSPAEFG